MVINQNIAAIVVNIVVINHHGERSLPNAANRDKLWEVARPEEKKRWNIAEGASHRFAEGEGRALDVLSQKGRTWDKTRQFTPKRR